MVYFYSVHLVEAGVEVTDDGDLLPLEEAELDDAHYHRVLAPVTLPDGPGAVSGASNRLFNSTIYSGTNIWTVFSPTFDKILQFFWNFKTSEIKIQQLVALCGSPTAAGGTQH